ncbi:MAG: DNA primase [Patescibacteria group bacterium]
MPSSNVQRIKDKLDIVDVVGSYVKLRKAGKNYKGLSPFTSEKTPSFFVSPDKGLYYCFSSGKGGDIFSFVQEVEGVDFPGALKILADKAGIELVSESPERKEEREQLYTLLEEATIFFENNLSQNKEALEYLLNRKLKKESMSMWRLGIAPKEWRALHDALLAKGFSRVEIEKVGLIKKGEEGNFYDTFRDRIIFPIFDVAGRVIGFSGRILHPDEKAPKYLNSPDTIFFNKSEVLYGLHRAKSAIRKLDYSILVEGQMDIVMSHQGGFLHTVASSGTALTEAHLNILKKLSNRVIMAYDADTAGLNAALRAADLALLLQMEVKVAVCPAGKDPADVLGEDPEAWKKIIKESKHLIDFYLDKLIREKKDERTLARNIRERLLPYVRKISSSVEQAHFIQGIANRANIREDALWQDLRNISQTVDNNPTKATITLQTLRLSPRDEIAGIIYWQESLPTPDISIKDIEAFITKYIGEDATALIRKETESMKDIFIIHVSELYQEKTIDVRAVEDMVKNYAQSFLREEMRLIQKKIKDAEREGKETELDELLKKQDEISRQADKLAREI